MVGERLDVDTCVMLERLTNREREILDLAARHLTSKQIGPLLGIRPASVDTYMQAIIRKLEVAGRKDAVIAYLAARDGDAPYRDDLDFGLSPVAQPRPLGSTEGVNGDGPLISAPAAPRQPLGSTEPGRLTARDQGPRPTTARVLAWGSRSPLRRLAATAIAAMVLGLVTFGVVALGYHLNQTFDRMLGDHGTHPTASKAK